MDEIENIGFDNSARKQKFEYHWDQKFGHQNFADKLARHKSLLGMIKPRESADKTGTHVFNT